MLGRRPRMKRTITPWPPRCARPSPTSTSRPPGDCSATPPPPMRWPSSSALLPDAAQRRHAGATLAELVRASGYHISTGFVGTPLICDALCSGGPLRCRLPPADAARLPVLALPGDDGRDHDLGALGQHAAGRLDQSGRNDLVQPLRAWRGGRLAAPHRRRAGARRARLSPHRVPSAAGRRPELLLAPGTRRRTAWRNAPGASKPGQIDVQVVVPPNATGAGVSAGARYWNPSKWGRDPITGPIHTRRPRRYGCPYRSRTRSARSLTIPKPGPPPWSRYALHARIYRGRASVRKAPFICRFGRFSTSSQQEPVAGQLSPMRWPGYRGRLAPAQLRKSERGTMAIPCQGQPD